MQAYEASQAICLLDEISCQTLERCDRPCSDTSHGTPTNEARTQPRHQSQVAWKANTLERNPLQAFQHIQLFRPFNALCNHQASYFMREADEASGQCTPLLICIDRVSKTHIQLDDLGLEIEDMPHAGIACTSIVMPVSRPGDGKAPPNARAS
jgi:hypothetical protein